MYRLQAHKNMASILSNHTHVPIYGYPYYIEFYKAVNSMSCVFLSTPQYNGHQRHTRLNRALHLDRHLMAAYRSNNPHSTVTGNTKKITHTSQHVSRCKVSYITSNHVYPAWLVQSYRPKISISPFTCVCTMHTLTHATYLSLPAPRCTMYWKRHENGIYTLVLWSMTCL